MSLCLLAEEPEAGPWHAERLAAVAAELFPDVLPYVIGTPAVYGFTGFNGRTMADNAPEAMLSLVAGAPVPSGLKPSVAQDQRASTFPYVIPA